MIKSLTVNNLSLEDATIEDITVVVQSLRTEDTQEVMLATGLPQSELVKYFISFKSFSTTYKVFKLDGIAVGLTGTIQDQTSKAGIIWAVITDKLTTIPKTFTKLSQLYVDQQLQYFGLLFNVVWEKNISHVRWLSSLGFTFKVENKHGEFIPFYKGQL